MTDLFDDLWAETERKESTQSPLVKDNIRRAQLHPHYPEFLEGQENDETD